MTASESAPVADLREQMARALWEATFVTPWSSVSPHGRAKYAAKVNEHLLPVVTAHVAAEWERAVAEAVEPIRALLDPKPQPCICTERDDPGPGYLLDENWSPEFRGDTRSFTGYGYLDCPYCDDRHGNPGWRTIEPDLDDIRAALPTRPRRPGAGDGPMSDWAALVRALSSPTDRCGARLYTATCSRHAGHSGQHSGQRGRVRWGR